MKKAFFYIISFIITILVAVGAKADSFSSETLESSPQNKTVLLAKRDNLEETENQDIKTDYVPSDATSHSKAANTQAPQTSSQTQAISSEIAVTPVENIPTFRVTAYVRAEDCYDDPECFTKRDAKNGVIEYEGTFFYGHSNAAFDPIKRIGVGQRIRIIDSIGRTRTFQVTVRDVKTKEYLNGTGKRDGFTAGMYEGKYYNQQYSASFMTCGDGTNNDSTKRLILFAAEI